MICMLYYILNIFLCNNIEYLSVCAMALVYMLIYTLYIYSTLYSTFFHSILFNTIICYTIHSYTLYYTILSYTIGDKDLFRFAFLFLREPLYMSPYYPAWAVMNNTGVRDSIVQYYEEYDSTASIHTDTHSSNGGGGVVGGGGGAGGSVASYTTTRGKKVIPYFFHQLKHRSSEAFKYVIKGHNSEDLLSSACIPCDTEITSRYFIEKNNKRKLRGNLAENKRRILSTSSNTTTITTKSNNTNNSTAPIIVASGTTTTPPMSPSPPTAAAHSTESLPTTTTATADIADIASTATTTTASTTTASTTASATALVKVEHSISPLAVYPLTSPIPGQADFYIKFTAKVL